VDVLSQYRTTAIWIRRMKMSETIKVVVTDDDPQILLLTSTVLRRAGYEVVETSTGTQALEAVRAYHPDIVLLDVVLPDMTGIEVCRQIKADEGMQRTFVILISGIQVSSEYQAEGLNIGAEGYITKPISNKELLARVQSLVRIKRAEDTLREKEKEQQRLISELKEALAEIKTLKGFIPICASCKKIRNDEGYWDQLEAYISKHTEAVFSHGICPECAEKYRAEVNELSRRSD
jgi:response regulator RpfG family c-di-GMP phosphodiesterase